ncbi:hypothetical protein FCV25MIE_17678 [Fagus crenata]
MAGEGIPTVAYNVLLLYSFSMSGRGVTKLVELLEFYEVVYLQNGETIPSHHSQYSSWYKGFYLTSTGNALADSCKLMVAQLDPKSDLQSLFALRVSTSIPFNGEMFGFTCYVC